MQDLQIEESITFKKTPILQKYNTQQIQTLFIQFVRNLEAKYDEVEQPITLEQIHFKDLTKEEQEATIEFEKNKNKMKFYNLRPEAYGV